MEYLEFTGKSVDEALTNAAIAMGVPSDELDYTVIEEASSGFLGLFNTKPAKNISLIDFDPGAPITFPSMLLLEFQFEFLILHQLFHCLLQKYSLQMKHYRLILLLFLLLFL